jgi:hypothetical protein
VVSLVANIQVFSLIIQTVDPAQATTSSLFALIVASVRLLELRFSLVRVANFLVGLCILECFRTHALHMSLVSGGAVGVACIRCISRLLVQ